MSQAYAIDVHSQTAGVAVGVPGDFKFFSSGPAFDALEGRIFPTLQHVNRAARDHVAARTHGRRLAPLFRSSEAFPEPS